MCEDKRNENELSENNLEDVNGGLRGEDHNVFLNNRSDLRRPRSLPVEARSTLPDGKPVTAPQISTLRDNNPLFAPNGLRKEDENDCPGL